MSKKKNSEKKGDATGGPSPIFIKIILAALVFILYSSTMNYEFVLDDDLFIKNNPLVTGEEASIAKTFTQGSTAHFRGGNFQIYRPAQISLFYIENSLFGMDAGRFHFISLLLYSLLALVVFSLIRQLLPRLHILYQGLIALIFVIHPVHTEVVANVKSQDELLASLGCLSALLFLMRSFDRAEGRKTNLLLSLACFLPALFSKESSVAFIAIFPTALFLLRNATLKQSLLQTIPFAAAAVFFLLCRHFAIRDTNIAYETSFIENVLYAAGTTGETLGTKLGIAFYYIRLMFLPYPLSWDYSFNQIPVMNIMQAIPLISLVLYLGIAALIILNLKKQPAVAFGLSFFIILITPTANVFFPNGTSFADRFLFLPSFGFILAMVCMILAFKKINPEYLSPQSKISLYIISGIFLFAFGYLTMQRNADWENNYAVFKSGARNSPNSSRAVDGLATTYMNLAQATSDPKQRDLYVDSSIRYFQRSLEIYPDNNKSSYSLGYIYSMQQKKDLAIKYYRQSIGSKPDYTLSLTNLGSLYANMGNNDSAYYLFTQSLRVNPNDDMTLTNMCIVSSNLGKWDEVIKYGESAVSIGIRNPKIYNTLSMAYEKKGDMARAMQYRLMK